MWPWKTAAECVKLQIFSPPAGCWMFPVFYCRIDLPGGVLLHWSWSGKTACHCWTGWRISSSTPYSESSHFSSTGCSVETNKKNNQGHWNSQKNKANLTKYSVDTTETSSSKSNGRSCKRSINRSAGWKRWNKGLFCAAYVRWNK